ncbi:hypothetical protein RCL1_007073 [Eukaryota sp. TZLM3-RCL]
MAYHSIWNSFLAPEDGNTVFLPLRSTPDGQVQLKSLEAHEDIVEETLRLFKANVLIQQFNVQGHADRILIYLTLCTVYFLKKLETFNTKEDAERGLYLAATEGVKVPGDADFILNSLFSPPKDRRAVLQYFTQLRKELASLLVSKVFVSSNEKSKWWLMFSRMSFLGLTIR